MAKLTYTNDQQIINDAAQMLIVEHLQWTGSYDGLPSRDYDGVRGKVFDAYVGAKLTYGEWHDLDEYDQQLFRDHADLIFNKACQIADRKWQAAMTLLGIED